MATLCGALSWLSKTIEIGLPAGAVSVSVENLRSLAAMWRALGSVDAVGPVSAVEPEQATRRVASARRGRDNVTCFIVPDSPESFGPAERASRGRPPFGLGSDWASAGAAAGP